MNKTDKFNDYKKVSASCNHSSSETTVEQTINIPDKSSGANLPNPLMSVNNVYNCDTHPWPKKQGTPGLTVSTRNVSLQTFSQLKSHVLVAPR